MQNWKDVDDLSMRVQQSREEDEKYPSDKIYCSTLVEMDKILMDDSFLELSVRPMIHMRNIRAAVEAFYDIAQHRAHGRDASSDPPTLCWFPAEGGDRGVELLAHIALDLLSLFSHDLQDRKTPEHDQTRVFDIFVHLLSAVRNPTFPNLSPIHGRLIELLGRENIYDTTFLQKVANVISTNEDNFEVDIECMF